jgi:phosphotransferase system IIA component
MGAVVAVLLIAGLWTPIAGIIVAILDRTHAVIIALKRGIIEL